MNALVEERVLRKQCQESRWCRFILGTFSITVSTTVRELEASEGPQRLRKIRQWCEVAEKMISIIHAEHWNTVEDNLIIADISQTPT